MGEGRLMERIGYHERSEPLQWNEEVP
jgi:hypothetical protein